LDEHTPVLVEEVLTALAVRPQGLYVDATFGRGGHSQRILQALGPSGRLVALDRDPQAVAAGRRRFADEPRLCLVHAEFGELRNAVQRCLDQWCAAGALPGAAAQRCDGVLFDFGVSSPQLADAGRGFSFTQDGPLDMRMDPSRGRPVSAWLAQASREEIREVIGTLGEERFAGRIATAIVRERTREPLQRTAQLAALVGRNVRTREPGKHPATRTFQALRMHVNDELGQIQRGLEQAVALLAPGGRLVTISFHSLEDRTVKQFIRRQAGADPALAALPLPEAALPRRLRAVGRAVRPASAEIAANARSRSAVMRVAERLGSGEAHAFSGEGAA
jgi:16S rRNA (cytosine1402-N4)-methyltransferase